MVSKSSPVCILWTSFHSTTVGTVLRWFKSYLPMSSRSFRISCAGHGRGNDFSVGEQKLTKTIKTIKFKSWFFLRVISYLDQTGFSILCEFDDLNCYPFLAAITAITNVCDVAQNIWKSTEKTGGAGCITCSPNNFIGEHLLPLLPLFQRL